MQNIQTFEKSLTPAQRARLKVYWHLAVTALFASALAGLGLVDQFKTINLQTLVIALVSGVFIAFADGLRKYYQASGEPLKAAAIASLETVAVQKAPALPKPDATGVVLEQAAQAFIPAPVLSIPATSIGNPNVDNAPMETQNTLPDIAVIRKQFASPLPTA